MLYLSISLMPLAQWALDRDFIFLTNAFISWYRLSSKRMVLILALSMIAYVINGIQVMEFPLKGADGAFRWFLTRVNPLRDSRGRLVRWFGTNTDVDGQRRTAEDLREANRAQGRVPRHGLARAAHAAHRHPRLGAHAARRTGSTSTSAAARARDHRAQRARAGAAHRRPARRLAHHHRQAAARRQAGRPRLGRRGGDRGGAARRPRRRACALQKVLDTGVGVRRGRPGAPAAGRLEPALERHQVHAQGRAGAGQAGARRRARRDRGQRHGARASSRSSCRTSSSASGRPTAHDAPARRARPGAGHRAPPGRAARRHGARPRARAKGRARRSS